MLNSAQQISLIKNELDATLQQVEIKLKAFSEGTDEALSDCIESFQKIFGTVKLLELTGAELLANEILASFAWLKEPSEEGGKLAPGVSALTMAITFLGRYFNYLSTNNSPTPELLLPVTNELLLLQGKDQYPDSLFFIFNPDENETRLRSFVTTKAIQLPEKKDLKRLRHMYQVGLLDIIRDNHRGFRLMRRALQRVEQICGDTNAAAVWPIAQLAVDSVVSGDVALTRSRKLVFAWLDRELKQLSLHGEQYLNAKPPVELLKELCYLVAVSDGSQESLQTAKEILGVSGEAQVDAELRKQRNMMLGPDSTVIQAVSTALNEELTKIKDAIDLHCRDDSDGHADEICCYLEAIGQTLNLLELNDLYDEASEQLKLLKCREDTSDNSSSTEIEALIRLIFKIESTMLMMLRYGRVSDVANDQNGNGGGQLGLLEEARNLLVEEARSTLALAKTSITSFWDSGRDAMHLGNVPSSLHSLWGVLYFLEFSRMAKIILQAENYINQRLLTRYSEEVSENELETLADVITGVDYYLEGIAAGKPLGVGILEVAEESLASLGCPVEV